MQIRFLLVSDVIKFESFSSSRDSCDPRFRAWVKILFLDLALLPGRRKEMDFDDEEKQKDVSKTRRFPPGRARKPKPDPTPVHPSQTDAPSESVSKKKKTLMEEEEEEEDVVVREIDVFYNPSIGANTEVS